MHVYCMCIFSYETKYGLIIIKFKRNKSKKMAGSLLYKKKIIINFIN